MYREMTLAAALLLAPSHALADEKSCLAEAMYYEARDQGWRGMIFWLGLSTLNTVRYKAGEFYHDNVTAKSDASSLSDPVWTLREVWDPPLEVELGNIGQERTFNSTGYFYFNGNTANPNAIPTTLTCAADALKL